MWVSFQAKICVNIISYLNGEDTQNYSNFNFIDLS